MLVCPHPKKIPQSRKGIVLGIAQVTDLWGGTTKMGTKIVDYGSSWYGIETFVARRATALNFQREISGYQTKFSGF